MSTHSKKIDQVYMYDLLRCIKIQIKMNSSITLENPSIITY
ncbi:MAG: hypothetical protein ACI86M_002909 [Saprospiraceae bacterium]|jgi:hypothetical protein